MSNGKGSKPRITKKYAENFDSIFRGEDDNSFDFWKLKHPQGNFFDYCADMEEKFNCNVKT